MTPELTSSEAFRASMDAHDAQVLEKSKEVDREIRSIVNAQDEIASDIHRIQGVIDRAPAIIHDINTQFEQATKLKGKDIAFLFGAAALQTARWILLPEIDWKFEQVPNADRQSAAEGGKLETASIKEYLQKEGYDKSEINDLLDTGHIYNYTWEKLLVAPVPYDAMHGSARIDIPGLSPIGKEINGRNHHAATWGHDPIWGWVFGPLNITSRMITFRDFKTYHVKQLGDSRSQVITYKSSLGDMVGKSFHAWSGDSKKLFVSVAKQGIHIQSDKYTKGGLPIPFVDAVTAQALLNKGWNSNEVERLFSHAMKNLGTISAQFGIALLIDSLVKALHLLCYDESTDGSIGTYAVKTQKIVCYSSLISELANVAYVAATGDVGKIDVGGYLNLAKNLIQNSKLQAQMKAEFLEKELERLFYGDDYYFLEVDNHGI